MVAQAVPAGGLQVAGMDAGVRDARPIFAYSGLARGHDYELWREEFCRRFCRLDAVPMGSEEIECSVQVARVGTLSFGTARGSSGNFLRSRSLLPDGCDDLVLVTAIKGDVQVIQHGRSVELKPSEMSLTALDEVGESALSEGGAFTALRIPRRDLLSLSPTGEDHLSMSLLASPGLRSLVSGYYALCTQTAPGLDAVGQQSMARHMTELVGLLLRAEDQQGPGELGDGARQARLQIIKSQVLSRLSDDNLSVVSVAQHAGLTPKQVQRLFGSTGVTFSEFVLEERLLLAHRLLSNALGGMGKISAIAQDSGFGDLSYFNRSFRRRFGMTPSEWRDANLIHH